MNTMRAFSAAEIGKDHGVGVVVFQPADVTVPNLFRFLKGVHLVRIVQRKRTVQGGGAKIFVD